MLDDARTIIKAIMTRNTDIIMDKKRQEMELIREELMIKACHPKRIAAWVEVGFDSF
jgi:hypothetical protein